MSHLEKRTCFDVTCENNRQVYWRKKSNAVYHGVARYHFCHYRFYANTKGMCRASRQQVGAHHASSETCKSKLPETFSAWPRYAYHVSRRVKWSLVVCVVFVASWFRWQSGVSNRGWKRKAEHANNYYVSAKQRAYSGDEAAKADLMERLSRPQLTLVTVFCIDWQSTLVLTTFRSPSFCTVTWNIWRSPYC